MRQLGTVFGHTRGLSPHPKFRHRRGNPRYPIRSGDAGGRAMMSYDEGETWGDEVYYMDYTPFVGSYNASVVLADNLILTIVGMSDASNSWNPVVGWIDMTAIH